MIMGLTGGIGSGKSTAVEIFREMGAVIIDADKISREVSEMNEVKEKLECFFPEAFEKHILNRKKMRNIIFGNKENVEKLNSITHPMIIKRLKDEMKTADKERVVIVDIPLLFEVGFEKEFENIVVISALLDVRLERIRTRDNCSKDEAMKIIEAQMSQEEKDKRGKWIIENNGTKEEMRKKIYEFVKNECGC